MAWNDDEYYLGESLRGMQETHMGNYEIGNYEIGAAQALARLKGQLGNVAQQRFNPHAPISRRVGPSYKDSTQIGIDCTGTFTPANWSGSSSLPTVSGSTRVYQTFKPAKAVVTESLIVTFSSDSLGDSVVAVDVDPAGDTVLISAFSGAMNCFPTAPQQNSGIAGQTFASNALGVGISWPAINGGIDMTVSFALRRTAVYRATPPAGYTTANISTIEVLVHIDLLGPSLRP